MSDRSQEAWCKAFAEALGVLSGTVTAHRRGLPDLGNAEYRELARRARVDVNARVMLDEYLTEIDADPSDVIELVAKHPAVGAVFGGRGKDAATFVTISGQGFSRRTEAVVASSSDDRRKTRGRDSGSRSGQISDAGNGRALARLRRRGDSRTGDGRHGRTWSRRWACLVRRRCRTRIA